MVLLPITHTPLDGDTIGIEIPAKVKQAIGLDDARSWVIVSEHNIDEWPNAGLAPVPGKPGIFGYGFIPPGLFAQIKARFLDLARQNKSGAVRARARLRATPSAQPWRTRYGRPSALDGLRPCC